MKTFVLVIAGCLIGAGTSPAGILKMSCKKPICPCTCYGPCAGYFPTQWRVWPCPTPPSAVVEAPAPAAPEQKPAAETPPPAVTPPAVTPPKKTAVDVMIPPTVQAAPPTVPSYIQQTWHVAP